MSNKKEPRIIQVSYFGRASRDVEIMAEQDYWSFVMEIKRVCKQNNLDIYNYTHFLIAIDVLKHQVSWN